MKIIMCLVLSVTCAFLAAMGTELIKFGILKGGPQSVLMGFSGGAIFVLTGYLIKNFFSLIKRSGR